MTATRLIEELRRIGARKACSDAERRAGRLLAGELKKLGRRPRTETHWIRPQWPAVWLVHAIAGVAGSVAATEQPAVALGVLGAATLSALVELGGRFPALSLLWPRRATQNIASEGPGTAPVRLLITAAYDSPRKPTGLGAPLARLDAALRRATRGRWPSPLALLTLALAALAACAGVRLAGTDPAWLGVVQLLPTVVCIAAVGVLAELALAETSGADNPGSAPAAALALVTALDQRPPRRLEVDVVFAGAGSARAAGMRRYVRKRRKAIAAEHVAVVHLEPLGSGEPAVWRRDGAVLPLKLHPQLVEAAEEAGFTPYAAGGTTGAYVARTARWPAVAIGRLPARDDVAPGAVDATVEQALALIRRLDARVAGRAS